jgi:predicted protein tyrosine phosphatase
MKQFRIDGFLYDENERSFLEVIAQKRANDILRPVTIEQSTDWHKFIPVLTIEPKPKAEKKFDPPLKKRRPELVNHPDLFIKS